MSILERYENIVEIIYSEPQKEGKTISMTTLLESKLMFIIAHM